MCGFAGILGDLQSFDLENEVGLPHRGPDFTGEFLDKNIFLVANRLAITDPIEHAHQPFVSDDKKHVLCFNGEVYNFNELRADLNYEFKTNSDTEVLLVLLMKKGIDAVKYIRGIFSFVYVDLIQQKAFLVRDQFGIKPLFYVQNNQSFLFSSEVSWLRKKLNLNKINKEALSSIFRFGYNAYDQTFIHGVNSIPHGSYSEFDLNNRKLENKPYYKTTFYKQPSLSKNSFYHKITEAIHLQKYSKCGLMLSGGLDSSILYKLCSPIKSYAVNTGELYSSDVAFAKELTKNNLEVIDGFDNDAKLFNQFVLAMDQPNLDPAAFNSFVISKKAKDDGIKVLFSGLGADDILGGYRRHIFFSKVLKLAKLPRPIKVIMFSILSRFRKRHPLLKFKNAILSFKGNTKQLMTALFENDAYKHLFNITKTELESPKEINLECNENDYLNAFLCLEQNLYLPKNLLCVADNMSMAHGVELRVPYLDQELVFAANNLEINMKRSKSILKEFANGLLDNEIINRKKTGFGTPPSILFNADFFTTLFNDLDFILIQKDKTIKLLKKYRDGDKQIAYPLYGIAILETWVKLHLKK